jgi:hypothetical protein
VWATAVQPAAGLRAVSAFGPSATPGPEDLALDVDLPPRERAIYRLRVGAEIDHALMVQCLFAAFSLEGPHLTEPQQRQARQWHDVIVGIAREEMGHLSTVENLLALIGGPLSFECEDYPAPTDLYLFEFELEPATKESIGKYVLAEMPTEEVIAQQERNNPVDHATRPDITSQGDWPSIAKC